MSRQDKLAMLNPRVPMSWRRSFARFFDRYHARWTGSTSSATTRVTIVVYIDEEGEKQFELPGWGPSLQGVIDSGIEANFLLGQVWVERPYRALTDAPSKLTVVDLWSIDGNRRMAQELAGHIVDRARIDELLAQRLGNALSEWKPDEVHHLTR